MLAWIRSAAVAARALVYPARCCACDSPCLEGSAFCPSCALSLELLTAACARCGLPLCPGTLCVSCLRSPPPYAAAHAPYLFGGALARAVRRLKWGRQPELAGQLGALLPALDADVVIPVPLHPRRLRERQFNQAAVLAFAAADAGRLRAPIDVHALQRTRDTLPQTTLKPDDRKRNVRGAFSARRERIAGRRVLLLDDVVTTGATVAACTRALHSAGARQVVVLTLARAMP
jgi:ComF family protein